MEQQQPKSIEERRTEALAKREQSAPIATRRKRSAAKLELDATGVKVNKVARKVQPSEIAANRVNTEVAEIATAYVEEWNQKVPLLGQFMEDVLSDVGAAFVGEPVSVNENGVSLTFEDEAA